jgi:methylase of polypeptide subunit release factors
VPPEAGDLFDGKEMVFPLHYESFAVIKQLAAHITRERHFNTGLDVFCGSGVLGIYAVKLGVRSVTFVDKYLRSLAFSMLNCHLNGITGVSFKASDCLHSISRKSKYSLILANPPFEAVLDEDKDNYYQHSHGGETGQEFLDRLLEDVGRFLEDDGLVLIVDFLRSNN